MPTIRQSIGFVVLVIGLAVALRILLPVPVISVAAIFALFAILDIIRNSPIGRGANTAWQWTTRLLAISAKTAVAVVIFLALRFLVGQWLRIYPVDSYTSWGQAGGAAGLFWGRGAELALVWELLFAFVAAWLVYLWAQGKARRLVATVFAVSLIVVTFQLMFPMWAATWPTRYDIDEILSQKGLVGAVLPDFGGGARDGEWMVVRAVPDQERAVKLPYLHWFDLNPEELIVVRNENGDEFLWKPDDTVVRHAGDCKDGEVEGIREIPKSILYLRACNGKIVRVGITVEPATMQAYQQRPPVR